MAVASVIFDIRAGVARLGRDFARAEKSIQAGMKRIRGVMSKAAVGLAAYMGVRAIGAFAGQVTQLGDDIDKMSQRFGVSAESLQAFQYGAQQSGASVNNLQRGLKNLSERIGEVSSGVDRYADRYERFGVSLIDANGQARQSEDVLMDIADVLSTMPDGAAKTEAAMKMVGVEAGPRLLPFLNQGSEGLRRFREEAESMGLVMSSETVGALSNFSTNLGRLSGLSKGYQQSIMSGLAQPLEAVTERMFEAGAGADKYAAITEWATNAAEAFMHVVDGLSMTIGYMLEPIWDLLPSMEELLGAFRGVRVSAGEGGAGLQAFAAALKIVRTAGLLVRRLLDHIGMMLGGIGAALVSLVSGDIKGAFDIAKDLGRDYVDSEKKNLQDLKDIWTTSAKDTVDSAGRMSTGLVAALDKVRAGAGQTRRTFQGLPPAIKQAGQASKTTAQDIEKLAAKLRDNALETDILVAESLGQTVEVMKLRLQQEIVAIEDMLRRGELTEDDFRRRREALERQTEQRITEHLQQEQQARTEIRKQAMEDAAREAENAQQVGLSIGESITQGFKSAFEAESFRDVLRTLLSVFSRVAAFIPGGQIASGVSGIFAGLFADGGLVRGPGGDRTDNLIGLLSPGEFVNQASTVRRFGLDFFERLNQGVLDLSVLPRYASGGPVGDVAAAPAMAGLPGQAPTVYIQAFDPRSTEDALGEVWEPAQYRRGMSRQDSKTIAMMRRRMGAPRAGR